ncbi:MAG: dihydroorotate dehydrogenase electron transfer subunit [Aquificae bacterium]|nr:dihydroorotate dehydrogenase electron transfer subunit [Aquificota bacterium]
MEITDGVYKITENRFISGRTWVMKVQAPNLVPHIKPASFAMLRASLDYQYDPLLRRAFAIADVVDDELWFYYDVYGKGTKLLTQKKSGDYIQVLAPLGNNFFPEDYDHYILVGGGIGFAGLSLFMKYLREKGKSFKALYGVRRKEQLSMLEWIEENNFDVIIYTEDGSFGKKGLITQDLEKFAKEKPNTALAVCGPYGMMKAVVKLAKKIDVPCFVSLESKMACGFGICIGCVVKDTEKNTYVRVCYEGPVFDGFRIEL